MRTLFHLAVAVCVLVSASAAPAQSPVQVARASLEQAHTTQAEILQALTELAAGRQRATSINELLGGLTAIHQMQLGVVQGTRSHLARTFGRSADALSEEDRQAIEQLVVDERAVRQRLNDWIATFARYAEVPEMPAAIIALHRQATASPAGPLMDKTVEEIQAHRLAEAAASGLQAADEVARLLQGLETAVTKPDELRDKRIRELQQILEHERRIRAQIDSGSPDLSRLRREQGELAERARLLSFEEAGLAPGATAAVRDAHEAMRAAEGHLRRQSQPDASEAAGRAITALQRAIEMEIAAAVAPLEDTFALPMIDQRKPEKPGGMPALLGTDKSGGIDVSPIAQLAADLALIVRVRKAQSDLYAETTGKAPPRPVPAGRQLANAARLPQIIRRLEIYLPDVAILLEEARLAMVESTARLRAEDQPGSAVHQELALDRLLTAEVAMREFWKDLLEALSRIATTAGEAAPMGAEELEEAAKMDLLMILMREIVNVGHLIRDQEEVIATTQGWLDDAPAMPEPAQVAELAGRQRDLSTRGLEIVRRLLPLGEEAETLPVAVVEAAQFMEGAADMLDVPNLLTARERQDAAMHFLENAWSVIARSMASQAQGQQSSESEQEDREGVAQDEDGEAAGATAGATGADGQPWYWDLPPRAREATEQSLAEPFPPAYDAAIKRYYERLSRRNQSQR